VLFIDLLNNAKIKHFLFISKTTRIIRDSFFSLCENWRIMISPVRVTINQWHHQHVLYFT